MVWIGILVSSFIIALSGALMPGPVLTVTISKAATRGFWAGPLIVLGHGILELLLVVALVLGLSKFINNPLILGLVGIGGGIILLWMGVGMLRSNPSLNFPRKEVFSPANPGKERGLKSSPVLAGVLTSLANPYWTIWWATIGLSYILLSLKAGRPGIIFFFSGHIAGDLIWYSLVALTISQGRRFMGEATYKKIIQLCGLILLGFGIYFGLMGIKLLL